MTSRISSSIDNKGSVNCSIEPENTDNKDLLTDNKDLLFEENTCRGAGFLSRQRELFRRRLWSAALTFVCCLLYHVVGTATVLTNVIQGLAESSGEQGYTAAERLAALTKALSSIMGLNAVSPFILTLPLAAILAIEGFSWMDSRREVDFYESQPVSRAKRFGDICASSFLFYVFSYVISVETGLILAGAMGGLTRGILLEVLLQSFRSIAMFLSVYSLGVLSAMLTGNVIVAILAFCVLLLYEIELKAILAGFCSEFLSTYDGHPVAMLKQYIFSPLYHVMAASTAGSVLRLLALAAFFFLLAFICYRLRKNEWAESAVIFAPVRSVVRVAMSVLIGLFVGLLFVSVQENLPIAILWMLLFTVLTACIMQIIYDYDFRALFHHPLEIAAALVITLAVFLGFLFDIAGYDRYLPDPGKVEDAALIYHNYDTPLYDEKGRQLDPVMYGSQYMHLKNVEDAIALAGLGQEYTRRQAKHNPFYRISTGENSRDGITDPPDIQTIDMDSYEILSEERSDQDFLFTVVYRMKNGKTVSRRFMIPSSADPAVMDAVTGTLAFREGTFNIYHDDAARKNAKDLTLEYTNGEESAGTIRMNEEKYEAFRTAYLLDLEQFSYSFARTVRPVGRIYFGIRAGRAVRQDPDLENYTMNCDVYPSFSHTIAFLKENNVWVRSLDYDTLPRYDDPDLSRKDRERIDSIDWSVFNGLFNSSEY